MTESLKRLAERWWKCVHCDTDGWSWVKPYGWVCCAECNDDGKKPKPIEKVANFLCRICGWSYCGSSGGTVDFVTP